MGHIGRLQGKELDGTETELYWLRNIYEYDMINQFKSNIQYFQAQQILKSYLLYSTWDIT